MDEPAFSPEQLLEHRWLDGLARALVRNDAQAADAVQETWLSLLRRPPATLTRALLSKVLRNRIQDSHRQESSRRERESRAARSESVSSTPCQMLERVETHRQLVGFVLELDEPFRSAVIRRFFEGLSPKQIATREGVAVTTVRTRLNRALELLRNRLDRAHGERGVWRGLLAPLLFSDSASGATEALAVDSATSVSVSIPGATAAPLNTIGALGMAKKVIISTMGAAVLAVVGLTVTHHLSDPVAPPVSESGPTLSTEDSGGGDGPTTGARTAVAPAPATERNRAASDGGDAVATRLRFAGTVRDVHGNPVVGATVAVVSDGLAEANRPFKTTSVVDGSFRFEVTAANGVQASAPPRVKLFAFKADVGLGFIDGVLDSPTELAVTLDALGEVTGVIYDGDTEEGISGLSVRLGGLKSAAAKRETELLHDEAASLFPGIHKSNEAVVSDDEGRYAFRGIGAIHALRGTPPGRLDPFTLRLSFDAQPSEYLLPGFHGGGPLPEITLEPGERRNDVDVALTRGGSISGTVFGPDGMAIPGAHVKLIASYTIGLDRTVECDETGSYRFDGLPPNETYVANAWQEGLAPGESQRVAMPAPEPVEGVDVRLGAGHSVHGRFIDDSDLPIAGMTVGLVRTTGRQNSFGYSPVVTADDGSFSFEHVAPGSHGLRPQSKTHVVVGMNLGFKMPPDRDLHDLEIVLAEKREKPSFIGGRVVDSLGAPVANIPVVAGFKSVLGRTVTADDGTFRIEGLDRDKELRVSTDSKEYWDPGATKVPSGTTDVTLVVSRYGSVHGRVRDASTGKPIEEFQFRVVSFTPLRRGERYYNASRHLGKWSRSEGSAGEFTIEPADPTGTEIQVRSPGYVRSRSPRFDVPPGGVVDGIDILMTPGSEGGSLRGVVVDVMTGEPIPGVRVRAHQLPQFFSMVLNETKTSHPDKGIWTMTMTEMDGRFELDGLQPGEKFHLAVWKDGYGAVSRRGVSASEWGPGGPDVTIALAPEATLVIEARYQRSPDERFFYYVYHREERPWDTAFTTYDSTDRSGVVEFSGLPPGRFRLAIYHRKTGEIVSRDRLLGDRWLELTAGERHEISLDLDAFAAEFGSIAGIVTGTLDPKRVFLNIVSAKDPEEHYLHREQRCGADGRFHLPGLAAGEYVITASDRGAAPPTEVDLRVKVGNGEHRNVEVNLE